jgi:signal transduction histidine kinase
MMQDNSPMENKGTQVEPQRSSFRAKARIISEIGDELISSDSIALYELIKNAYDADSSSALIEVSTPLVPQDIEKFVKELKNLLDADTSNTEIENKIFGQLLLLINDQLALDNLQQVLQKRDVLLFETVLKREVRRLSKICIADEGHGMNQETLENAFLTVGTPMRRQQRKTQKRSRVPLGEKGVGRFSAKRLGNHLLVETKASDESRVYYLEIDWSQYASDSDLFLDEVTNLLWSKIATPNRRTGTTLIIEDLNEVWSLNKLKSIAHDHLSKLMNPFFLNEFRIIVRFNRETIDLLDFQEEILKLARLKVKGCIDPNTKNILNYQLIYDKENKEASITQTDYNLRPVSELIKVGAFSFEVYDFDRQDPNAPRLGRGTIIGDFIDKWGGGIMLFRDGFRILPYGTPGNDWLGIDKAFFKMKTGGSRLRTYAMLGYISVSSEKNPNLLDQTNREGLRENEAYDIFRDTLIQIIKIINLEYARLKPYGKKDPKDDAQKLSRTEKQLDKSVQRAQTTLSELELAVQKAGNIQQTQEIVSRVSNFILEIRDYANTYKEVGQNLQQQLSLDSPRYQSLLELASLGMTAETVSHELNSLLDRIQSLLIKLSKNLSSPTERALMGQLTANLQSLRRLATFLEPLTRASRQKRLELDVAEELKIVALHYPELASNHVQFELIVIPHSSSLKVNTNRGLLLQVFDNLFANSLYWLSSKKISDPKIIVQINSDTKTVTFEDNGLGIDPNLAEPIFQPFISTKPRGRGLGLFIVRELLELEECHITLLTDQNSQGRLYRFEIELGSLVKQNKG